ncbi:MAG: TatD family hydrolase [Saprospiraceae bacterium]
METSEFSLVDTHTHIYATEFDEDRDAMIRRAIASGVDQMMMPNLDKGTIEGMWQLAEAYPSNCFPMLGLHPCLVKEDYKTHLRDLESELINRSYSGIGETGIDLYWDATTKEWQIDAFNEQIRWAKELNLPVIIHSRESLDLNIDLISHQQDGSLKGIFHCFGGNLQQAIRIHSLGFKIGIGGVVTYKNSGLDLVLPEIPLEMIVLETDAPYLAPIPHRGKRNEPAYLNLIADRLAIILGIGLDQVARETTRNAREVFGKKG